MAEKQTKTIVINDKEYTEDQLTDQQKMMVNHITDLERKIGSAKFNLDQMIVGRDSFTNMLAQSVEAPVEAEIVDEEEAA